jgi:hypothetical protein
LILEEQQDYQSASSAYLIWPLALAALLREPAAASRWTRIHTRQALMFGLVAGIGFIIVMALPLLVVIGDAGISTGMTVGLYTAGLLLDAIVFIVLAVLIVSPLADRVFTIRR